MNVGIYIYDNAEVLDFSGPYEVFSTAARLSDTPVFNPFLIAEKNTAVIARANYQVLPHYSFDNHPPIDLLIVVGGVHTEEMEKTEVIDWIKVQAQSVSHLASVCTGAFLLAKAGLLHGKQVTTHWEDIADLKNQFPDIEVIENTRWVEQENLVTSAGISAGIDMSLYLVQKLASLELAEYTAEQMEFDWTKA